MRSGRTSLNSTGSPESTLENNYSLRSVKRVTEFKYRFHSGGRFSLRGSESPTAPPLKNQRFALSYVTDVRLLRATSRVDNEGQPLFKAIEQLHTYRRDCTNVQVGAEAFGAPFFCTVQLETTKFGFLNCWKKAKTPQFYITYIHGSIEYLKNRFLGYIICPKNRNTH